MGRPALLHVDLTINGRDPGLLELLSERCDTRTLTGGKAIDGIGGRRPDLICFEFDFPDIDGLTLLKETKRRYPSIPILMVTEQHSEELATWAFRAHVWDFLVKPVLRQDIERCLDFFVRTDDIDREPRRTPRELPPAPPLPTETRFRGKTPEEKTIGPALDYVKRNLRSKLREKEIAALCDMSPYKFSRMVKRVYGITFQEIVLQLRVHEACRLLAHPHASVTDVAYSVGFNDPSYFSRIFKRYMHKCPSNYRSEGIAGSVGHRLSIRPEQI